MVIITKTWILAKISYIFLYSKCQQLKWLSEEEISGVFGIGKYLVHIAINFNQTAIQNIIKNWT